MNMNTEYAEPGSRRDLCCLETGEGRSRANLLARPRASCDTHPNFLAKASRVNRNTESFAISRARNHPSHGQLKLVQPLPHLHQLAVLSLHQTPIKILHKLVRHPSSVLVDSPSYFVGPSLVRSTWYIKPPSSPRS